MKKMALLIPILTVATMLFAQENKDRFIRDFSKKWADAKTYTLKVAESMPDSAYGFKPVPEEMSFGEQLVHIAQNMTWLCAAYLKGEENPFSKLSAEGKSKQEIINLLDKAFDYAAGTIDTFDPSRLDDTVNFFSGPLTKRRIFFLLTDHVTHHRGQLVVYLRLKGIKPPAYVGW